MLYKFAQTFLEFSFPLNLVDSLMDVFEARYLNCDIGANIIFKLRKELGFERNSRRQKSEKDETQLYSPDWDRRHHYNNITSTADILHRK